jgi:ribosome-binding factor A
LTSVSLTRVRVGSDLTVAHVNYLLLALEDPESPKGQKARQDANQGLRSAKPFLKREIARALNLRSAPELMFHWDSGLEHSRHMESIFAEIATLPKAGPSTSPPKGAKPEDEEPVEAVSEPVEAASEPVAKGAEPAAPARRWGFAPRKREEEEA